jgi:hypothetical protein
MWSRYYEDFMEDEEDLEDFMKRLKDKEETEAIFALSDETELYATI